MDIWLILLGIVATLIGAVLGRYVGKRKPPALDPDAFARTIREIQEAAQQQLAGDAALRANLEGTRALEAVSRETPTALPRECRNCKHFDLPEGQAVLRHHPTFLMAAETLSPAKMSIRVTGKDAEDNPIYSKPCYPHRATWAEFGACMNQKNGEPHLQWQEDSCEHYEPKVGT